MKYLLVGDMMIRNCWTLFPWNSADAVQAEILNEYQREFIAEGQLFFYHKRMKDEKLNGYTVNYVFPKPDTETEFGK